jgi:putative addiction module CopG family antidote
MTIDKPLTPHLEQFIREQLAAGRFQSETDVIRTALRLLEEKAFSKEASSAWLKQELDKGLSSRPSGPATKEFWDQLRDRLRADSTPAYDA